MSEKYLIINAGSSSLKFSLYQMPECSEIVNGYIEKIGSEDSLYTLKYNGKKEVKYKKILNHTEAIETMLAELIKNNFISDINEIKGVGHRVTHGGEKYKNSVLITDEVIGDIKSLTKFAPLHHPGNLAGINAMRKVLSNVPNIAVFDTAFHQTMPKQNYIYPVPYEWYTKYGVRKYGFHGTSHKYITETMQKYYDKKDVNLIICHLGSGASISCIKDGLCYNTTMGLTPLDGLMMCTRCGNIDSSIIEYMCKENNFSIEEVMTILNKQSGLLGIAGKSDFRDVESQANNNDENSTVAIQMLKNSIIKYIAQYYFELEGKLDAIVFTAGIGESAINLRESIVSSISNTMNVRLDKNANNNIARTKCNQSGRISTPDSSFEILVIPTNEEYMILKDTYDLSKEVKTKVYQKYFKKDN